MKSKKKLLWLVVAVIAIVIVVAIPVWVQRRKETVTTSLQHAVELQRQGKLKLALREINKAMEFGADKADCYSYRASYEHFYGHLTAAEIDYKKSLKLKPENYVVWSNLSDLYYRLDDMDAALDAANNSLKYLSRTSNALANRAQVLVRKSEYQQAINDTTDALWWLTSMDGKVSDTKRNILVLRAAAYRHLNKTVEAESDLNRARRIARPVHRETIFATNLEKEFAQKIVRPRFVLCTDTSASDAQATAEFLDRFLTYVDKNISPLKPDSSFHVFIFSTKKDFKEFLTRIDEHRKFIGLYVQRYDSAFTFASSDKGCLAHEIMHRVLEDAPFIDIWAKEGIPALFEQFYGYPFEDNYKLALGIHSGSRISNLGRAAEDLPLVEVLSQQEAAFTESRERLAAIYLFRSGKLHRFMELSQSGELGDFATAFETALGRTAVALEPDWQKYLAQIESDKATIRALPDSRIFENKQAYEKFVSTVPDSIIPQI